MFFMRILLLFYLSFLTINIFGQSIPLTEFNSQMGRYYKACLFMREGVKLKSPQKFENAMKLIHKDSIMASDFTPIAIDTLSEVPVDGHFMFTYARAKQGRGEIYVDPGNMREEPSKFSKEEGRCFVMHRALKAYGKTSYSYKCPKGSNCLVIVCELKGEIELSVISKNNQNIETKSYEYDAVGLAKWESEEADEIKFSIENLTGHEISFAVLAD